jgi:cytochrome c553
MRNWIGASVLLLLPAVAIAADAVPDWAYPATPPGYQNPPDNGQPKHVPGSDKTYTQKEIGSGFTPVDWYPNEHPPMPDLVAHGKAPVVRGCSVCHIATGHGHPESANVAGLPAGYIEEQLREFRNGNRKSSGVGRSANMIMFASALTDDEVKPAAAYFASIKRTVWTKVQEIDMVPKTFVGGGNMRFVSPGNAKEPLGSRIIEVPEDPEAAELRDPHSGFITYVPVGSIKAGEALATSGGNGKTIQCSICHGADYKGIGNVPSLAGRGATYIYRQLNDIQKGTRKGDAVALMQSVVAKLSQNDMIALAAFMSSRTP